MPPSGAALAFTSGETRQRRAGHAPGPAFNPDFSPGQPPSPGPV